MEKHKLNLKTALVILIGYAAHQSNPQYQFTAGDLQVNQQVNHQADHQVNHQADHQVNHQADTNTPQVMIERPYYRTGAQKTNSAEAFAHWAQAYQQRLNQSALTAKRN